MRKNIPTPPKEKEFIHLIEKINPRLEIPIEKPSPLTYNDLIATVILESEDDNQYNNQSRLGALKTVLLHLTSQNFKNGIIIFPAGMFYSGENPPASIYSQIESAISLFLASIENRIIICFGIDGSVDNEGYARDQIAVAIDRTGIIALGKKFYPAKAEQGHVNLAEDFNILEHKKSRIFKFGNSSFYLGMCYDGFGMKKQNIKNPGVSGFIELAHCFYPKGQGPSGESYFARHGFAGTARQWNCSVYGTAVFFKRKVPEHWPTGVVWNQGSISTTAWNYSLNPLKPVNIERMKIVEGSAVVRLFPIP